MAAAKTGISLRQGGRRRWRALTGAGAGEGMRARTRVRTRKYVACAVPVGQRTCSTCRAACDLRRGTRMRRPAGGSAAAPTCRLMRVLAGLCALCRKPPAPWSLRCCGRRSRLKIRARPGTKASRACTRGEVAAWRGRGHIEPRPGGGGRSRRDCSPPTDCRRV